MRRREKGMNMKYFKLTLVLLLLVALSVPVFVGCNRELGTEVGSTDQPGTVPEGEETLPMFRSARF